jgi:hypothetical protein
MSFRKPKLCNVHLQQQDLQQPSQHGLGHQHLQIPEEKVFCAIPLQNFNRESKTQQALVTVSLINFSHL